MKGKKLKFSDEELIELYRGAKDKNKQIDILADMRCCKPQEIISMLSCAGELNPPTAERSPLLCKEGDSGMRSKVKGESEEISCESSHRGAVPPPLQGGQKSGKGAVHVPLQGGQSGGKAGKVKKMKAPRWTSEELEKLQEYIDEGMSYSEIADKFGRSKQSIYDAVSKHKLKGRKMQSERHDVPTPHPSAELTPSPRGEGKMQNEECKVQSERHDVPTPHPSAEPIIIYPSTICAEKNKSQTGVCDLRGASAKRVSFRGNEEASGVELDVTTSDGTGTNENTEMVVLEKCVDAAEKRVVQLSNAIADAGAAAKILHDIIRVAGSGIEDMCEDPVGAYQTMLGSMEELVKDIRKILIETGEEYVG